MALTRRIGFARFDRFGGYLGRLDPKGVTSAVHTDALDGTDELKITCSEDLKKGERLVWIDRRGVCHEHIVDQTERAHEEAGKPATQATCINSVNETWDDWVDDKRPSGTAQVALTSILEGTRWEAGTCDQPGTASHTFYHQSVREALADLVDTWGGEVETTIRHTGATVTGRSVGIRSMRGDQDSPKRFTWTKDLVSVRRTVASDNPKSRVYCYGKGVETESGAYGRRLTIAEVNGGKTYVEDAEATALYGHPDGKGGTLPSCTSYVNEECEDASQLMAEGLVYLGQVKEPKVTYTASVIDLEAFGRSWEGVGVGDSVAIIDKGFSEEGVRLRGRVSQIERDLLTGDATVTFGNLADAMADMWQDVSDALRTSRSQAALLDAVASASPSWLTQLQAALNAQYNSVGTYHVESFELGEIWSNVPLDQSTGLPVKSTSGMWAVNINGMGIRLAASLTSGGEWDWKTFVTGEGATADLINVGILKADLIKAGVLQDAAGKNYINMETGEAHLSSSTTITRSGKSSQASGNLSHDTEVTLEEYSTFEANYTLAVRLISDLSAQRSGYISQYQALHTDDTKDTDEGKALEEAYEALDLDTEAWGDGGSSPYGDYRDALLDLRNVTTQEELDSARTAYRTALSAWRSAARAFEEAAAAMNPTKVEMTSAIEASAESLTSTFTKTISDYSTTEQMNSAIEQKAESITTTVSETYETKASARARYARCTTAAATQAKVATCSGFELYAGAVVSVYFLYANTASSPTLDVNGTGAKSISVNGSTTSAAIMWKAYSTITFVYDGGGWRMADAGARSEIRQLADSISLSVSGSLGGTASIKLSADGDTDTGTVDLSDVRAAFRDDHTAISLSAGTITFNSNTFVCNSTNFKVTSSGTVTATDMTATNISATGTFTCGSLTSGKGIYLTSGELQGYNGGTKYGTFDCGANVQNINTGVTYHGFELNSGCLRIVTPSLSVLNGTSGTSTITDNVTVSQPLVKSISDNGDGTISWRYGTFSLTFIHGMLTSYSTVS